MKQMTEVEEVIRWKIFHISVFLKSRLCSQRLHLFDQKYSKISNIVKCYSLKQTNKNKKTQFLPISC